MVQLYLVDDEKMVVDGLLRIPWVDYGIQVIGYALDGITAEEEILMKKPDVVIVDIRMPRKSGLDVIESVRRQNQEVVFIIYSAYSDFSYAQRAIKLGAVNYLLKPSSVKSIVSETVQIVRDTLNKREIKNSKLLLEKDNTIFYGREAKCNQKIELVAEEYLSCVDKTAFFSIFENDIEKLEKITPDTIEAKYILLNLCFAIADGFAQKYSYEIWQGGREKADFFGEVILKNSFAELKEYIWKFLEEVWFFYQSRQVSRYDKCIEEVKFYIDAHLNEEISLDILSKKVNFAPAYLSRLFKNYTGISLTKYITDERMKKSKYLLRYTNLKINEIAEKVGLENQRYFCQVFKKYNGISASEYRSRYGTIL